tara:strand:- start:30 stop:467 length:438 start_codon:yes stop_codon:yes gene_type:complete
MNTVKLKRELLHYFSGFPDELRDILAPRVEATLRIAIMKARAGMPISRGSNNLKIDGLPKIDGPHTLKIDTDLLELVGFRLATLKTVPTFSAGFLFHLRLPFSYVSQKDRWNRHCPKLRVTEALEIDLSFSDEINEFYFDYLSDT